MPPAASPRQVRPSCLESASWVDKCWKLQAAFIGATAGAACCARRGRPVVTFAGGMLTSLTTVLFAVMQKTVHSDHAAATAVSLASYSAGDDDTAVSSDRWHTGHGGGGSLGGDICSGEGVAEGRPPQLNPTHSRRVRRSSQRVPVPVLIRCSSTDKGSSLIRPLLL